MYVYLKEHDSITVNSFKVAGIQCSHNYHDHHSQSCIIRKMHHFLGCKCIMDTLQELYMDGEFFLEALQISLLKGQCTEIPVSSTEVNGTPDFSMISMRSFTDLPLYNCCGK